MKKISFIAVLLFLTVVFFNNSQGAVMKRINPSMTYKIDRLNLQNLKKNAFKDNGENAFKIYRHYNFATKKLTTANRWLFVCTLFGNKTAIHNFEVIRKRNSLSLKKIFKFNNEELEKLRNKKELYAYLFLFYYSFYYDNGQKNIYLEKLIKSQFPFKDQIKYFSETGQNK